MKLFIKSMTLVGFAFASVSLFSSPADVIMQRALDEYNAAEAEKAKVDAEPDVKIDPITVPMPQRNYGAGGLFGGVSAGPSIRMGLNPFNKEQQAEARRKEQEAEYGKQFQRQQQQIAQRDQQQARRKAAEVRFNNACSALVALTPQ